MIFENYYVILIVNVILAIFLVISIAYIVLINFVARISARKRKLKFMEWDTSFMSVLDEKTKFSSSIDDPKLFAVWSIRYFNTFKGEVVEKLITVCSQLKIQHKMAKFINSDNKENRILGMVFFYSSNQSVPEHAKSKLLKILETKHDIEFFYAVSLLASTWSDDYALTVLTAMNREDLMTMNIKLSVARKMDEFIKNNYEKLFNELGHDMESRFFMIEAAGYLKIKDAFPILKELYEEGNPEEQIRSMKAISDLGYHEFADSFYDRFLNEQEPVFQSVTFKSFLNIATKEDIPRISTQLESKNWFVRYAAAKALSRMGEDGKAILLSCRGHDACELALAESGKIEREAAHGVN